MTMNVVLAAKTHRILMLSDAQRQSWPRERIERFERVAARARALYHQLGFTWTWGRWEVDPFFDGPTGQQLVVYRRA